MIALPQAPCTCFPIPKIVVASLCSRQHNCFQGRVRLGHGAIITLFNLNRAIIYLPSASMACFINVPIWAGDLDTITPADSRAAIWSELAEETREKGSPKKEEGYTFCVAPPLPPEMMAPAWPVVSVT